MAVSVHRSPRRRRHWRGWMVASLLLASGCRADDVALGGSAPPSASSSSTTEDGDLPVATPPDVGTPLPEGCGDGIIDPAQLCYRKVRLVWADLGIRHISTNTIVTSDLDQDGRDELLMQAKSVQGEHNELMLIAYDDGKFVNRWQMPPGFGPFPYGFAKADRDLDGDGDPDLMVRAAPGFVAIYENEGGVLAPRVMFADDLQYDGGDSRATGYSVPFDSNGDGAVDKLAGTLGEPGEVRGGWIFERDGDTWRGVEGPRPLTGCQIFGNSVYGDFDGDGVDDFAVRDLAAGCDPYLPHYDPEWWRFYVFLTRPEEGSVHYVGSFPAGGTGVGTHGMYALDFDEDGDLDLIFSIPGGVSFIPGKGDGTFEEPLVFQAVDQSSFTLSRMADFDGDGRLDMFIRVGEHLYIAPLEPNLDPDRWRRLDEDQSLNGAIAVGDFNGDGLADVIFEDPESEIRPPDGIMLLSAP